MPKGYDCQALSSSISTAQCCRPRFCPSRKVFGRLSHRRLLEVKYSPLQARRSCRDAIRQSAIFAGTDWAILVFFMRGSPVRARPEDEPRLLPHNRFLKTLLLARFCNRNRNATGIPSRNYHFRKVAGWNSAALTHCLSTHRRLHLVGWRNIAITLTTPESLATGRLVAKREVLWIFRQHCQLDTFQRRFPHHGSWDHEIMSVF